jgi:hydroxypyruvate isomerase
MLASAADAMAVVKETGCNNVKVLYDIYHMAIMGGNQTPFLHANMDAIGHFHIAGVPGRHEPDNGEVNYAFLLKEIAAAGYEGYVGLEYFPLIPSKESLLATAKLMPDKPDH